MPGLARIAILGELMSKKRTLTDAPPKGPMGLGGCPVRSNTVELVRLHCRPCEKSPTVVLGTSGAPRGHSNNRIEYFQIRPVNGREKGRVRSSGRFSPSPGGRECRRPGRGKWKETWSLAHSAVPAQRASIGREAKQAVLAAPGFLAVPLERILKVDQLASVIDFDSI
jgi:hypothetical protein